MAKIAMIGAGSLVFCKTLISDFLATPVLKGSEYRLMAPSHKRLDKMHDFVKRMIKDNGVDATVVATTDRRAALKGADYCSHIIEAKETGNIFCLNGNIRNDGYITNLPNGCCVEVPIYVYRTGLHATVIGNLPPQCAALNMTNVLVQQLAVEASFTGDPELVMQAIALDPLTAAVLTLDDIRRMTAEMLDAEAKFLPQFAGKKLRTVPAITVPKNVKRQEVPVDPALAIANRFGKLANA